LDKFLYSYLNSITSARYGNFNSKIEEGFDPLTKQLGKNTNAFFESVRDRDKMLKEYIEKERERQNIKQDFISSLTHDLKVPIIAQDNTYDLLLAGAFGELNSKQKEVTANLKISNMDLKNLVINLLDVQKLEVQDYKPEFERVNLVNFINSIIEQNRSVLTIHGKTINFSYKEEQISANIDPVLIKRALNNLISNAIYYSKKSKNIYIELNSLDNEVEISVIDEGEGIDEKELNNIFQKYYTCAKKYSNIGAGLGLYIVNKIILAHNGKVKAQNRPDAKGAKFSLCIPK